MTAFLGDAPIVAISPKIKKFLIYCYVPVDPFKFGVVTIPEMDRERMVREFVNVGVMTEAVARKEFKIDIARK